MKGDKIMSKDDAAKEETAQGLLYPRRNKVLANLGEFAEEIIKQMERNNKAIDAKKEENEALNEKLLNVREALSIATKDMPYDTPNGPPADDRK